MKGHVELKKIDNKEDNIVDFNAEKSKRNKALSFGGDGGDENWLANLDAGTVFLAKDKTNPNDLQLAKYMVVKHYAVSTHLLLALPKDQVELYVPTLAFSRKWTYVETLGVVDAMYEDGTTLSGKEYPKLEEENSNGEDTRPL